MTSQPSPFQQELAAADERARRRRVWLRIAATVALVATSSCVGCFVVGGRAAAEGAEYARAAIRAIALGWDADNLLERAAPEMNADAKAEQVRDFIQHVGGRLGPLTRVGTVQNGPWTINVGTQGVAIFSMHYADCDFEKAKGRITLQLVKRADWRILAFNVNSDALFK